MADAPKTGELSVFIFPRKIVKQIVSVSPHVIKLETWLRLNKIKYQVVETMTFSKQTHTIPYIHLNGKEYTDANFIIPMLMEHYGLDPTEGLTPEQQAVSRALHAMTDESLSWTYVYYRSVHKPEEYDKFFRIDYPLVMRKIATKLVTRRIKKRTEGHGIGRHSMDEMIAIGNSDIKALSQYLGDKQFMFGDTPTKIDCIIFGHLSQIRYVDMPSPFKKTLDECPNMAPYLDRIKNICWPDWDDLVDKGTFE